MYWPCSLMGELENVSSSLIAYFIVEYSAIKTFFKDLAIRLSLSSTRVEVTIIKGI